MSNRIFFTPGPTQLFYTYQDHLKEALKNDVPSISHRSKAFQQIFAQTREALKTLLGLKEDQEILFTSSANEIWERIIQNLVVSRSHHFVNGAFAEKFYEFAQAYQKKPTITRTNNGLSFQYLEVPSDSELIAATLNETSNGFSFTPEKVYELKRQNPDKILAVDGVSALPSIPLDFEFIDTAFFSVQKCFGMPAGLGIWIVNKKCLDVANQLKKDGIVTGSYHALDSLWKYAQKDQTPETPNALSIFILGKIVQDMITRGIQNIRNETTYKSAILYDMLEKHGSLSPFIKEKAYRSKTVIVAQTKDNMSIINECEKRGWILGKGYGDHKVDQIRIANFPMHSKEQMEQLVDFLTNIN